MNGNTLCAMLSLVCLVGSQVVCRAGVTIDDIVNACKQMETSIKDISITYEWWLGPPLSRAEAIEAMASAGRYGPILRTKEGHIRYNLVLADFMRVMVQDGNKPGPLLPTKYRIESWSVVVNEQGQTWPAHTKHCFNGQIGKSLRQPQSGPEGTISTEKMAVDTLKANLGLSPLSFTVFWFPMSSFADYKYLSSVLTEPGMIRFNDRIERKDDFNVVSVDFLHETTGQRLMRAYFSVDHNYAPVRFEWFQFDSVRDVEAVDSLMKIGEGIWFPAVGRRYSTDSNRSFAFVVSEVKVNQGLTAKDFDLDFPPGTRVDDKVEGINYTTY